MLGGEMDLEERENVSLSDPFFYFFLYIYIYIYSSLFFLLKNHLNDIKF